MITGFSCVEELLPVLVVVVVVVLVVVVLVVVVVVVVLLVRLGLLRLVGPRLGGPAAVPWAPTFTLSMHIAAVPWAPPTASPPPFTNGISVTLCHP
jgi:hypothetical protein